MVQNVRHGNSQVQFLGLLEVIKFGSMLLYSFDR